MTIRTRITQVARSRGFTAAEVARRTHLYPSNLSAMDAGTRSISLKALARVARVLDCSPADLVEASWGPDTSVFRDRRLVQRLQERDLVVLDGTEKGWVHATLLAWQRHAGFRRRRTR